jgi:hypothetical protein
MVDVFEFHNFILDAVLFILFAGRYLWGRADDMLRMAFFFYSGWAVVGDMNLYYGWNVPWFNLELYERQIFGKGFFIFAVALDLMKDYWEIRRKQHIKRLVASTRRSG